MSKLTARIKKEFLALLPPTIFFLCALHLVVLLRVLMLKGTGIPFRTSVSVTVLALIFAKAVLIADLLPFINRYPSKPLVYNVVWKTAIYMTVAVFITYVERLIDFSRKAGGVVAGHRKLLAEMVWQHYCAVLILLLVLILMYCTTRELVRMIGADKVRRMFFGPLPEGPIAEDGGEG